MEHVVIFVCMYVNAVANSVMLLLYLLYDFYKIVFKARHKLYTLPQGQPQQSKILGAHLQSKNTNVINVCRVYAKER